MVEELVSRREYLVRSTLMAQPDVNVLVVMEAVYSTAIEHPEWDLDEERTWEEWERSE